MINVTKVYVPKVNVPYHIIETQRDRERQEEREGRETERHRESDRQGDRSHGYTT